MDKPKVSVIVPVYNVEPYLRRCVDSILAQTLRDIEIILVDDGSPDGCPAICDSYALLDSRVKVIHKENGGLSDARNAGMQVMTGEYVGFVDGDDWIHADMFSRLYHDAIKYCTDVAKCNLSQVIENETQPYKHKKETGFYDLSDLDIYSRILSGLLPGNVCVSLFKVSFLKANALTFFDNSVVFAEDTLFIYETFLFTHKIAIIDEPLYYYWQRLDSLTKKPMADRIQKHINFIIEFRDFVSKRKPMRCADSLLACLMWDMLRIACTRHSADRKKMIADFFAISNGKRIFKLFMLNLAFGKAGRLYIDRHHLKGKFALHFRLTALRLFLGHYPKAVTSYFAS